METTQFNKYGQRRKRTRSLANKEGIKSDNSINTYLYPKNNLYTRQEFELLDSIYSDESPGFLWEENSMREQARRNHPGTFNKRDFLGKAGYLITGMMLTSVIWLVYLQFHDHSLRTKNDTQIVFQKSAEIVTHGSVDKQVAGVISPPRRVRPLADNQQSAVSKQSLAVDSLQSTVNRQLSTSSHHSSSTPKSIKSHTIKNGDSLWLIANKYYSNPSPENINKIMKANKLRATSILSLGQKIVIP